MNLTHYQPNRLFGNLDEFLNQTLRSFGPLAAPRAFGAYRYEEKDSYRLRVDLPGFTREEVTLTHEKDTLTLTAKSEREDAFHEDYERTFTLPDDVDPEGITAKLENGVLDLTFAKVTDGDAGVRTIEIA
jgi:HSP20 family protein